MSLDYHRQTAYSRQELGGHYLDWSQRPHPFKRYRDREALPLAAPRWPRAGFFDLALGQTLPPASAPQAGDLAAVLWLAAGLTAQVAADPEGGGLRAWASAGALYPCELYVNACGVADLEDGLYHFAPAGPGLVPLWPGPHAADLARRLERPAAALHFFLSAYYWRSLWKYRSRAYRYCLLDAGHLAANLELATAAAGFPARPVLDFPDRSVNVFLGLASDDEAAVAAFRAGPAPAAPGPDQAGLPPLDREALPLSARVGRDQAVLNAYEDGMLEEAAVASRLWPRPKFSAEPIPLPAPEAGGPDLRAVLAGRRSRRNFVPAGLSAGQVARLLATALPDQGPCLATVLLGPGGELPAGAYLYLPQEMALASLGPVGRRARVATACLNQLWVGQASLVLLLWADLEQLQEAGGSRTYRHAQLFAGRAGQRLYLAATAQGLGCCGVGAFYDRELAEAAGLPPRGWPLYLLACGPIKGGLRQS